MSPRATKADARRASGLLLAFVLVVSQASAWFHAVAISHVACLEHGEAMHRPNAPVAAPAARPAAGPALASADLAAAAGHDHCTNAALLRWRDVGLTAPSALTPVDSTPRALTFAAARDGAHGTVVYLIAPKTSPPPAAA
jgi:hypothetical protein